MQNQFLTNYTETTFLDKIKDNLRYCKSFYFSVSFIKKAGLVLLFKDIEAAVERGCNGYIITSTYQNFTDIESLKSFHALMGRFPNFQCHLDYESFHDSGYSTLGYHSKGYLFEFDDHRELVIGSSNITRYALVKKTTKIMFGDAGISGTAQYMSQLVWVLFLKVFDYKEEEWELEGDYEPVIPSPFRFRDWADPRNDDGSKDYSNRITGDKLINFVNNTLFSYLRGIETEYNGKKWLFDSDNSKAKIIRSFMAESQNYMKDGVRLRQLINEIGDVDFDVASQKHDFNDFYERLLKELQNGGKATGEFYTPRALTQFIVDHVDPKIGERVADFACGTGGFLADTVSHLQKQAKTVDDALTIQESIYGIEWKQLPYMLCVTNMYLHNIDDPNIVHGDGLYILL